MAGRDIAEMMTLMFDGDSMVVMRIVWFGEKAERCARI